MTADTDVVAEVLSHQELARLLVDVPTVTRGILKGVAARLRATDGILFLTQRAANPWTTGPPQRSPRPQTVRPPPSTAISTGRSVLPIESSTDPNLGSRSRNIDTDATPAVTSHIRPPSPRSRWTRSAGERLIDEADRPCD